MLVGKTSVRGVMNLTHPECAEDEVLVAGRHFEICEIKLSQVRNVFCAECVICFC